MVKWKIFRNLMLPFVLLIVECEGDEMVDPLVRVPSHYTEFILSILNAGTNKINVRSAVVHAYETNGIYYVNQDYVESVEAEVSGYEFYSLKTVRGFYVSETNEKVGVIITVVKSGNTDEINCFGEDVILSGRTLEAHSICWVDYVGKEGGLVNGLCCKFDGTNKYRTLNLVLLVKDDTNEFCFDRSGSETVEVFYSNNWREWKDFFRVSDAEYWQWWREKVSNKDDPSWYRVDLLTNTN